MAIVILYSEVTDAPIVITGIHVIRNKKLTIIRFARPVRNLVPALLGLKKEGRVAGPLFVDLMFSLRLYVYNEQILSHYI